LGDNSQVIGKYAKEEAILTAKHEIKNPILKEMTLKSEVNNISRIVGGNPRGHGRDQDSPPLGYYQKN
jgi:hypothetical protein